MIGSRVKLRCDLPDEDVQANSLGTIVNELSDDDHTQVVVFDSRPNLRLHFASHEFMPESREYRLDVVSEPAPKPVQTDGRKWLSGMVDLDDDGALVVLPSG